MAQPLSRAFAACFVLIVALVLARAALAQEPREAVKPADGPASPQASGSTALSPECRCRRPAFEGRVALSRLRKALREGRIAKVLAIGSSSTVGLGASSPFTTYTYRLEADLEGQFRGTDFDIIGRGISGEIAEGAAERMKLEVARLKPDLVVWQVGTNDAMHRLDVQAFAELLRSTLQWLARNKVDVVLIDPQYVEKLAQDEHYLKIVQSITQVARESRVLLVHRFDAMEDLAKQKDNGTYLAGDRFHLNDLGYRCMAEYAARAIASGLMLADAESAIPKATPVLPPREAPKVPAQ